MSTIICLQVLWYRDTLRLDTTERRSFETRGSRHTLIIRKVQASDFGNFSCVADNTLGKMRQYLQLSGRPQPVPGFFVEVIKVKLLCFLCCAVSGKPNQVAFNSNPVSRYHDSYNISWVVNSYTPIEEFKLFFRRIPENGIHDSLSYHQYSRKYERRVRKLINFQWFSC